MNHDQSLIIQGDVLLRHALSTPHPRFKSHPEQRGQRISHRLTHRPVKIQPLIHQFGVQVEVLRGTAIRPAPGWEIVAQIFRIGFDVLDVL